MKKKLFSIIALLCLTVSSAWADGSWTSGGCDVTLVSSTLTVSKSATGNGAMTDFASMGDQPWNSYKDNITSVVIESGVTSIGQNAFAYCSNLTSIEIPASVTTIGNHAFERCEGLTSITFASGSHLTTIGESAFNGCYNTNLTSIVIPASVTSIGNSAFESCSNLASVTVFAPTTCTLGSAAFYGCTNLQIYVPSDLVDTFKTNWSTYTDKITAIGGNCGATDHETEVTWSLNSYGVLTISGSGAMTDLVSGDDQPWKGYRTSITSVVIESGVTSIGNWAFAYCSNLTSVTIPASVTSIGRFAFYFCIGVTSIEIPASVTSIGQCAFAACSGLTSITFASESQLKTIGESAFDGCINTGLTSIVIPASVTTIENSAFRYCKGLTSITIPASVTSIGNLAFESCSNLASVTVFSASCTLGTQAFNGCTNLANIYVFSDLVETYKGMTNWNAYSGIITAMTNPHGKCGASDHESDVRWVLTGTSPNYTLTIMKVGSTGAMADYGGDNQPWKDYRSNIKSVVIVNGVTTIGDGAFMACSNLATVTFDGNSQPVSFNEYAFSGCGFTSVTIPSNVTSIEDFTFSGCPNLTEVNIGKGVTSIVHHAFNSCPKLTTITVDTENTTYDSRKDCKAIIKTASNTLVLGCKDTTIPNTVTSIGDAAFWKCAGLTSIAIPASVTSIGASAFKECPDLTSVTFATGSQLTSIGVLAFYDCKSLASIEIPASVTSIEDKAFYNCTALTSITIPSSVTIIGVGAFFKCTALTSITIPASVTNIGGNAFCGCTNVTDVYCYADPESLTWTDNGCDDFIYDVENPVKTTVCHVAGSKLATFKDKWSTGNGGTDVNVTFMGDGFEPGGKAYLVKAITYKSGTMPDGVKAFLPVDHDLSTGTVTLAEVKGAPKGLPVIYGNATEDEALPDLFFLKYVADGSDADKAIQSDYADKAKAMSKRFVITDGEKTLAEVISDTGVDASEAVILVLTNGKFTSVDFSDADLDKLTKPGRLLFVLSKWEYMQIKPNQSAAAPIGARTIGIGNGNTTGITTTNFTNYTNEAGAWYDLQGRKLSKPTKKGIYIFNGKKVIK
jgi:hypothetical protein